MEKVHTYKLTYDDGSVENYAIRLQLEDAKKHYLGKQEHWDSARQREYYRTCVKVELVSVREHF